MSRNVSSEARFQPRQTPASHDSLCIRRPLAAALVLLLDGTAEIELQGTMVRMHPGDELKIPAGTRHTVRNCGEGPARWLHGYPLAVEREADAAQ